MMTQSKGERRWDTKGYSCNKIVPADNETPIFKSILTDIGM